MLNGLLIRNVNYVLVKCRPIGLKPMGLMFFELCITIFNANATASMVGGVLICIVCKMSPHWTKANGANVF